MWYSPLVSELWLSLSRFPSFPTLYCSCSCFSSFRSSRWKSCIVYLQPSLVSLCLKQLELFSNLSVHFHYLILVYLLLPLALYCISPLRILVLFLIPHHNSKYRSKHSGRYPNTQHLTNQLVNFYLLLQHNPNILAIPNTSQLPQPARTSAISLSTVPEIRRPVPLTQHPLHLLRLFRHDWPRAQNPAGAVRGRWRGQEFHHQPLPLQ